MSHSGAMKHRIVIEQNTQSQSESGQPLAAWTTFATVWAERLYGPGREEFASVQIVEAEAVRFRMWKVAGVTAQMRVRETVSGEIWNIGAVQEMDDRMRLELHCSREGAEDGV